MHMYALWQLPYWLINTLFVRPYCFSSRIFLPLSHTRLVQFLSFLFEFVSEKLIKFTDYLAKRKICVKFCAIFSPPSINAMCIHYHGGQYRDLVINPTKNRTDEKTCTKNDNKNVSCDNSLRILFQRLVAITTPNLYTGDNPHKANLSLATQATKHTPARVWRRDSNETQVGGKKSVLNKCLP